MAKKNVNFELNLAPFMGLFAMLVVVLLLTASWNQIFSFASDISSVTGGEGVKEESKKVELHVTIYPERVEMADGAQMVQLSHLQGGILDLQRVAEILDQWRQKYPSKEDVILNTDNQIAYYQMIEVFDTLVARGWPDVGVNTQ